jgi:hypothetical protein
LSSPRCTMASGSRAFSPPRGWRAEKRKPMVSVFLLGNTAGASRRATRAHFRALPRFALLERKAHRSRSRSTCHLRRLSVPGPASVECCAQCQRPVAHIQASASSWQDLLLGPGGAPGPPERSTCVVKPAGAAPRPAVTNASRSALKWTRCLQSTGGLRGVDKVAANFPSPLAGEGFPPRSCARKLRKSHGGKGEG